MCNQLTIEPLGATLDVAEGQTLLDAALRSGVYIPHACGHGLCGTCKVQVTSGEVDHGAANPFALMDIEREEGKTLACCATALSDVCIEADVDDEPDARVIPVRDFVATVTRIDTLTPTIKGLRLKLDQPIDFQAGQYVMVEIPGLGQRRAFSIANAPSEVDRCGEIELQVRRVPGGAGTGVLHEQLAVGDTLHVTGPYGRFFVRQSAAKPMLFVAGGSGLSSPRSMILDLLEQGCTLPITLVNGQRSREELYGHAEFVALADRHPNFSYVPVLSNEPEGSAWDGARGFAHDAAKAHFNGQFAGHKAYLCGPPPMVEAAIGALMQGRLFEDDIYTEKFLSAADANAQRSPLFKRV
ncbi:2Fe-2S iron-sulfur cluster binding domain-containing protein [Ralstonia pickettii]|jgi:phenol hydroxylase P5 protein|uniref:NADH:ubiquinone reductase (Na(+)-transporting) subunit F n=1 Tax=Ralstonia pickettii TaxID=329 RepID=UPI0015F9938D|nr:phenol 2-monooxygenase domain-containing protein [Ralstonia pickettii]MDE2201537.1 2Fe-2S iron-sulfur cluster binding domain-containing protein [Burkholderiaceae bacterium]MBA9883183.1 phenol hydroxylase [Ralstonia pickettii]MBA9892959.1 phenol hydroxylase [Ralstonia pickettii]MBA9925026.1 phenol hydroxylase [Ralstonia pickettii]MBB0093529.1 phenol hydroxylase [Ralstonia pickettii]